MSRSGGCRLTGSFWPVDRMCVLQPNWVLGRMSRFSPERRSERSLAHDRESKGSLCRRGPDVIEGDRILAERIRDGHQASFGLLLERYWEQLVLYATGIVGDTDGAQDVVQRTFIQVWRKRSGWTPSGTVGSYLYRITRNLALNTRRDLNLRQERHEEGGMGESYRARPASPDENLDAAALRAEVEGALARLPKRRREVFVLSRFHGLTHREIAETMGTSPQTVSNQMSAALVELRAALSHHMTRS